MNTCCYPNPCTCGARTCCGSNQKAAYSCPPVTCSTQDNPTYGEVVARLRNIECNLVGFADLAKRHLSVGDLIGKIEELCQSNNQLVRSVADLQSKVHKLENCGAGPLIVSIAPA